MSPRPPLFDRSVQQANAWLRDIETHLDVPRRQARAGLRAALHAARDRLPPDEALRFAGQLPSRLQGLFLEGWSSPGRQAADRSATAFVHQIATALPPGFPRDPETVVRASFQTAYDRLDGGEVDKVVRHLPRHVRELWLDDIG